MIYLDNAASAPILPHLLPAMAENLRTAYANPSAIHQAGHALRRKLERAADSLLAANCIPSSEADVIWTSGGTEANNLAILGHAHATDAPVILPTATEHPSIHRTISAMTGTMPAQVRVDRTGAVDLNHLASLLNERTTLVTICYVQNETGVIQDLLPIRQLIDKHAPHAVLHVDAVQAYAKLPIPWKAARIDLISTSSHKLHGPGGVGALIVRRGLRLTPILHGGGQQQGLRSGSLDAMGILNYTLAANDFVTHQETAHAHATELNLQLRTGLSTLNDRRGTPIPPIIHSPERASPYILSFAIPGFQGAILARTLAPADIMVSTGSACAAETPTPSAVLTAMGISRDHAFATLRISFGRQNTPDHITALLKQLQAAIAAY